MSRMLRVIGVCATAIVLAQPTVAQTTTYHLHNEASSTAGFSQLKTAGPDAASVALQTANLKSTANGEKLIRQFDTQAGVPGVAGVIPSGSTLTIQLWMRKTANVGTLFPRAKVFLNNSSGTALCTGTGGTGITTTLTKYTISCNTSANVTVLAASRFYVWAGANMTAGSTTTNFMAELDIEGTLDGNYDSQLAIPNPIPPPTITAPLVPASAGVGQSVTINGTNFGATQGTSTVKFFNNKTAAVTAWSSTGITATVPSGAVTGNVTVTVATQISNGVSFTVLPTPTISTLSPSAGVAGTLVTINGSNFGGSQGTSTVTFNGVAATSFTSWSATQIKANAPVGTTTGPVVVTVAGVPSAGKTFTVPPILTSLSPSSGHITEPVTITGSNFLATQGTNTVAFNGTTATPTSWSNTSITTPVPAAATTGNVVVTINGQASNGLAFSVVPPPTLTAVSPASTIVGESVWVSGNHFGSTQGASTVKFNGTTAAVTSWWNTGIVAIVPAGASSGNVVVTVWGQASNGAAFTVAAGGTINGAITRATGGTAIVGASVQALHEGVVKGSATSAAGGAYSIGNLAPGTYTVRVTAAGFATELRDNNTVSSSSSTTVNVSMMVPGGVTGKVTRSDGVTPIAGAAVRVFSGPAQHGGAMTNATGDYTIGALHPGPFTVSAGSAGYRTLEQSVTVSENATATKNLSLDDAATGSVRYEYDGAGRLIQVVDQAGATAIYRYDAVGNVTAIERPAVGSIAISAIVPSSGTVGKTVVLYGTGFSATPSQNAVTFNGVSATVTSATATQIVTTVPAGATTGTVGVTAPAGSAVSAQPFTVLGAASGAPTIASVSPSIGAPGTSVTITGTNFATVPADNSALVNVAVLPVSTATATSLTGVIPASAGSGPVSVATQFGTAVSTADFFVPPSPYVAADVDFTDRMTIGSSKVVTLGTANRIGLVTFTAAAGQHVSVTATASTIPSGIFKVLGPSTAALGSEVFWDGGSGFIDVSTTDAGSYTILVDPDSSGSGAVTLTLATVPADFSAAIAIDGSPVTVTTTTAGQRGILTFSATAGQRVSLMPSNSTYPEGFYVSVRSPSNAEVFGAWGFVDGFLPVTGTYTIVIDPFGSTTGSVVATLATVPADQSGTIVPGGSAVTVTIAAPGQNAALTFSGTAGQRVSLLPTNNSFAVVLVGIRNPDGSWLRAPAPLNGFIDPVTLVAPGTHAIVLDPHMENTGAVTLTLYDVPTDATASLTVGGAAAGMTISTPGQKAVASFTGTSGQQITIHVTGSTVSSMSITLRVNGFHVLTTGGGTGTYSLPTQTLGFSGTCTITFDPDGANVGSVTVNVTSP